MDEATLNHEIGQLEMAFSEHESHFKDTATDEISLVECRMRKLDVDSMLEKMRKLLNGLMRVAKKPEDADALRLKFTKFQKRFYALAQRIENAIVEKAPESPRVEAPPRADTMKYPKLNLPEFDGKLDNWVKFRDLFTAMVHSKPQLSDSEKFQYLEMAIKIKGPSNVLANFKFSGDNYAAAWKAVNDRYEDRRKLLNTHLQIIFNVKKMTNNSADELRRVIDTYNANLKALDNLNVKLSNGRTMSNLMVVFMVTERLEEDIVREWRKENVNPDPTWKELQDFLESYWKRIDEIQHIRKPKHVEQKHTHAGYDNNNKAVDLKCYNCDGNHGLWDCQEFLRMKVDDRCKFVRDKSLCYNCLGKHVVSKCTSKWKCKRCSKKHHTLLHKDFDRQPAIMSSNAEPFRPNNFTRPGGSGNGPQQTFSSNIAQTFIARKRESMLSTAKVNVEARDGKIITCRALIDSGSNINFISSQCASKLKLKRIRASLNVGGIGASIKKVTEVVNAIVTSRSGEFKDTLLLYVMPEITDKLPHNEIDFDLRDLPSNYELADEDFYIPSQIDLLLDNGVFSESLKDGKITLSNGMRLINTAFGYLISGYVPKKIDAKSFLSCFNGIRKGMSDDKCENIDDKLEQFFEAENVEYPEPLMTEEELYCEKIFTATTRRGSDGRFIVNMPFKAHVMNLGVNFNKSLKCLYAQENRRKRNQVYDNLYVKYMNDFVAGGQMTEVQPIKGEFAHYLPHHGVLKMSSTTTKLRPVCNASSKSESGLSLNDVLCVGPMVQPDSYDILLRFRQKRYVLMADITKMYLQIAIEESQRKFLRILWRANMNDPVKHYQLNSVTFGTAPASYLSTRVLKELANINRDEFPEASDVLLNCFYVDDMLVSFDTIEEGLKIREDVRKILNGAGMTLCKFSANNCQLIDGLPDELCDRLKEERNVTKALGIGFDATKDEFFYAIAPSKQEKCTKSMVLSEIASIYDPIGWIGPVVLQAKLFMKRLWLMKVDWKEKVSEDFQKEWDEFRFNLILLNDLRIKRHCFSEKTKKIELHGFADASIEAYGAVIYALSYGENGTSEVSVITAKSRVAPKNQKTLARLELCASVLLSKLLHRVVKIFTVKIDSVCCWSDSTIVLHWLTMEPARLLTFVGNRVAVIQELTKNFTWKHIPGIDNPADVISRGLNPSQFADCKLWWEGPPFFRKPQDEWPVSIVTVNENAPEVTEEIKKSFVVVASNDWYDVIETKFSNFWTLIKFFAILLRVCHNFKAHKSSGQTKKFGFIQVDERNQAEHFIIRTVQAEAWKDELRLLTKAKELSQNKDADASEVAKLGKLMSRFSISSLSPYLDEDNIIRVGGRTAQSKSLKASQKHQILLPACNFSNRLLEHLHVTHHHAGQLTMMGILKEKYWIVRAKSAIRKVVYKCVTCFKANPVSIQQYMANLPEARTSVGFPFASVAVDYAGYYTMKSGYTRNAPSIKMYVAVFKCMKTGAIHLEIVSDLTTKAFIAALDRFVSRRGLCSEIFSDNGTYFEGADNELKKIVKANDAVANEWAVKNGIYWRFTTPLAPHAGGIYESGVKSMKHHLKRILGLTLLTYEQFSTVLCKIESVLNSRPITPISDDPNDFRFLTPGHFLIGRPLVAMPERDVNDVAMNRLTKWEGIQKVQQEFWLLWSRDYLNQLQQRPKGRREVHKFRVGEIVLLKDRNLPPMKWAMGRIINLFPSKVDNIVRNVEVLTQQGSKQRHVDYVCSFPFNHVEAGEGVASQ